MAAAEKLFGFLFSRTAEAVEEVLGQKGDILPPVPERRNENGERRSTR